MRLWKKGVYLSLLLGLSAVGLRTAAQLPMGKQQLVENHPNDTRTNEERQRVIEKAIGHAWGSTKTAKATAPTADLPWLRAYGTKQEREVRAVWFCTYAGLDWPGKLYAHDTQSAALQKQALCRHFDQLQAVGINTILFQCRIRSTVAYHSQYEAWDAAFSGTAGVAPPYDVLAFAVEEAHKRGMELHAYLVVYPICTKAQAQQLGRRALPRMRPDLCVLTKDKWTMDPGVPATATYIAALAREIVERYDVDGIHLDYIRYPEASAGFNDAQTYKRYGKGQNKADWRRENVNRCVRLLSEAVRSVRPWVKISCSPLGKYSDLPRQSSRGWNARDAVSQDAKLWLKEGWMDMLFPMLYFDKENFYPFLFDWKEATYGRVVAPGLGTYLLAPSEQNWDLNVIYRQMQVARSLKMQGQAHFRSLFVVNNTKGVYDFLQHFYSNTVLPPAMTWADSIPPAAPTALQRYQDKHTAYFSWNKVEEATPVYYNIYQEIEGEWRLLLPRWSNTQWAYTPTLSKRLNARFAIRAMDAYGNESPMMIFP